MKPSSLLVVLMLLTAGCGLTGMGPAALPEGTLNLATVQLITPRSKGGTLTITPQSKGGTLTGRVVWPGEVAALASRRFLLKVYTGETLLAEGSTNAEGHFVLTEIPADIELRIEAHVPGRPFVILRSLVAPSATAASLTGEISMLTTAVNAIVLEARQSGNNAAKFTPQRLLQADALPLLNPVVKVMTPYLDTALSTAIENQAPVRSAVSEARKALEQTLAAIPPA